MLTDVTPQMRVFSEELFGPAAVVYRVAGDDEAVALVNGSPFGLSATVYGTSSEHARAVADRLDCGMAWINSPSTAPELPFGGIKRSGTGRELGSLGINEFANKKLARER